MYFLSIRVQKINLTFKTLNLSVHLSGWHNQCRSTSEVFAAFLGFFIQERRPLTRSGAGNQNDKRPGLGEESWNNWVPWNHNIWRIEGFQASVREWYCLVKKKLWSVDKMKQTLQQLYTKCSSLYLSSVDSSTLTHFHVSLESVGPHGFEKGWSAAVGSNNNYTYNPIFTCKLVW